MGDNTMFIIHNTMANDLAWLLLILAIVLCTFSYIEIIYLKKTNDKKKKIVDLIKQGHEAFLEDSQQ